MIQITIMMKRIFLIILFISCRLAYAGEGMWLPLFLKSINEAEMKSMGMKISAEDIYSINKGSLKDAVCQFGGGCTGEIISSQGLLLTNHHCGYSYIQGHSNLEHNYLKEGFWAKDKNEELPCSGLSIMLISRMEDVTSQVLQGVTPAMSESERKIQTDKNIVDIQKTIRKENYEDVFIRSFYNGNQFFAFVTVTYKDIRLVGTPPESIGKFGADTDNWIWPRHTGDFSIFRIYAGPDNLPATYSTSNKPYTPKHFLPVSMDGVAEGDFTMVFGFPGRTTEYLTEEGVRQITEEQNPVRIELRDRTLKIMDKYMRTSERTKLQYSARYASIANAWKKWIGENQGIKQTHGLEKKHEQDLEFQKRVDNNPAFAEYRNIINNLSALYKELRTFEVARDYYAEGFQRNVDLYNCYARVKKLQDVFEGRGEQAFDNQRIQMAKDAAILFKDIDLKIEKEIFASLLEKVVNGVDAPQRVPYMMDKMKLYHHDYKTYTNDLYAQSMLTNPDSLVVLNTLNHNEWLQKVKADPVWNFFEEMNYFIQYGIQKRATELEDQISTLRRIHMEALMKVFPERRFYPDANSTLRVTYGKVQGSTPRDGICYQAQTWLDGVMEKYVPGDYEFDVHPKLIRLYKARDYGDYGVDGKMPLAFIASNHTTGGNSGSPAIDANGNLIGLNFDRVWEGTMSDINYDPDLCRNIMVDARYILFIIDKFAGAGHLVAEMKLVHPKAKSKGKSKKK